MVGMAMSFLSRWRTATSDKKTMYCRLCQQNQSFGTTPFYRETPLLESSTTSSDKSMRISYKMESFQPSGSFKDRGISHMILELLKREKVTKIICSSGGNAGHAAATAGQKLNVPVDVFVPVTTLPMMIVKLRKKGAEVFVGGANWNEADAKARVALSNTKGSIFIPPYDDPLIWEGNSSIVAELLRAYEGKPPPDAIVLSVGGGGLLAGVQIGVNRVGWHRTIIFGVETEGAASFAAAKKAGQVVKLDKISTIASSLGALSVTEAVIRQDAPITESILVTDADAIAACVHFADEHKVLTEPACGAALAAVRKPEYREMIMKSIARLSSSENQRQQKDVVVIVCGGSIVNLDLMSKWRASLPPEI